jgi:hypothetical protein
VLVKRSKITLSKLEKCSIQFFFLNIFSSHHEWLSFAPSKTFSLRSSRTPCWYKIRDKLLGQNCVEPDIKEALELASVCEHPNAVWLTKLFSVDVTLLLVKRRDKFF